MDSRSSESILWGWERFFLELYSFLRNIEMLANEQFSEYAIECLEIGMAGVLNLIDQIEQMLSFILLKM